ncbi:MAG: hypothetical protein K2N67_04400 [Mucispirillum sp.]|nr:hypothetical protein [Mucispirillum sp.]
MKKDELFDLVLKRLQLDFSTVDVGFLENRTYPDGELIARVARKNNEGYGVPKREFMLSAADKSANRILNKTVRRIAAGEPEKKALETAAVEFQTAIQKRITDLKTPPNSPATIKAKGSSNPLIDTEDMRGAQVLEKAATRSEQLTANIPASRI